MIKAWVRVSTRRGASLSSRSWHSAVSLGWGSEHSLFYQSTVWTPSSGTGSTPASEPNPEHTPEQVSLPWTSLGSRWIRRISSGHIVLPTMTSIPFATPTRPIDVLYARDITKSDSRTVCRAAGSADTIRMWMQVNCQCTRVPAASGDGKYELAGPAFQT